MPKGENLLAQSKRTAPPLILKFSKTISQKGRNYFNWYLFHKREQIISIVKTLLTAKGGISSGGVLFSQRKSI
jgi:hypothetical protein